MVSMIKYIKYRLLLKMIINECFPQPFLLEDYKSKILCILFTMRNNWDLSNGYKDYLLARNYELSIVDKQL